jgi:hypothetical protein
MLSRLLPLLFIFSFIVVLSAGVPARAFAQAGTSGLTGTITDPQGNAMDRVHIVVLDPATGFSRETDTNSTGNYNIPGLRPGTYSVVATRDGFRTFTETAFRIEVGQIARLDVRLEIGAVSEVVEVAGRAQMLQTEAATLSGVIDSQKVSELPLNGRNFVQLALLVPGVNSGQPDANRGGGISINGTRSEQNSFQLDGVTNTNQWDSGISFTPSVDSIQEFRIEVNSYAAEFGRGAGGQIGVVTKSGTNELHGSFYEFNRNDALQARNFFDRNPNFVDSRGRFKPPPLNRNEFGAVAGGPVIRGRTFFFGDYQGTRQTRGSVARRTVPNDAFMRGDLSSILGPQIGTDLLGRPVLQNQLYNPRTSRLMTDPRTGRQVYVRDPYPNNQIPLADFDPVARRILQSGLWPAPNADGTRDARTGNPRDNYFDNRPTEQVADQFFLRIDHQFSSNNSIFARYGLNNFDEQSPGNFPGNERLNLNRRQVFAISHTKVFGSSMVNELRFGYSRERPQNGAVRILEGRNVVNELGIRGLPLAGPGAPNVTVTGFTGISDGGELRRSDDTFQIVNMFSFNKGRHYFKLGGEFRAIKLDVINNPANTRGDFIFENAEWSGLEGFPNTGNTFANFLLGLVRQKSRRPGDHTSFLRAAEYAGFIQDDFKVTPNLTINYGVRYQLYIPPYETRNHISGMQVPYYPSRFGEGGLAFCKNPAYCASINPTLRSLDLPITLNDLHVDRLPRVVVAGREVPRAMTATEKYDFGPRVGAAYRLNDRTVVRSGYGLFFDTAPISYYQDAVENLPWIREDQQSLSAFQFGLPPSEGFIGYLLNDPPIGSFTPGPNTFQVGFKNSFVHHWNLSAQRQLGNSMVAEIAYSGHWADRLNWRRNLNTAEPRSPSAEISTTVHPQFRRALPFAIFEDQLIVLDNWFETTSEAKSFHNALTGRFEKRYSQGLTFINSFTFGRTLAHAQPFSGGNNDTGNRIQNIFDPAADWGLAPNHHKYRLVSSFVWDLPFGRTRRFGANASGLVDQLIGGWQVNGIYQWQTGFPVTILRSGDPLGVGTDGAVRPDQVCDPILPRGERTIERFFATECFVATSDRFGNAGRATVIGPDVNVLDLAVFKNVTFPGNVRLQFRSEFFNFFNIPNWNAPGRTLGGSGFGEITSARDPRIIQLGAKLIW